MQHICGQASSNTIPWLIESTLCVKSLLQLAVGASVDTSVGAIVVGATVGAIVGAAVGATEGGGQVQP